MGGKDMITLDIFYREVEIVTDRERASFFSERTVIGREKKKGNGRHDILHGSSDQLFRR